MNPKPFSIPNSKKFCFFFVNPADKSGLGEFFFFGSLEDLKEQILIAFQISNQDGDLVEFNSKIKKLIKSLDEQDINSNLKSKLEDLANFYKCFKYLGPTSAFSHSSEDFCIQLRQIFWSSDFEDERTDHIPEANLEKFFKWLYTYPYG